MDRVLVLRGGHVLRDSLFRLRDGRRRPQRQKHGSLGGRPRLHHGEHPRSPRANIPLDSQLHSLDFSGQHLLTVNDPFYLGDNRLCGGSAPLETSLLRHLRELNPYAICVHLSGSGNDLPANLPVEESQDADHFSAVLY